MEGLFKKVMYTGIGLVAFATEKIQASVDDLVSQEKISKEEGRKIVEEFLDNTEAKKDEFENKLKALTEDVVSKFNFAKKDNTLTDLVSRIEAIEAKLGITKVEEVVEAAAETVEEVAEAVVETVEDEIEIVVEQA